MDKIFREIKKAIEEEMRNAESGPPPGGGRSQAGGGRRAQEYAEWLKEEQDRLRGGGTQAPSRPEPMREMQVEQPPEEEWDPQAGTARRTPQQRDSQQPPREQSQQRQSQPRRPDQQQPQRPPRPTASRQSRHDRQTAGAYKLHSASKMGGQIERMLRSPNGLRQAFLLSEIVSKPVSLRDRDDHLIS